MLRTSLAIAAAAMFVAASNSWGATLTEQRRELSRASTSLRVAERMARANRNDKAVAALVKSHQSLSQVAQGLDSRLKGNFDRIQSKLETMHAEFVEAGLKPPPLAKLSRTATGPPPSLGRTNEPNGNRVSFVDHVVPVLISKCGGCHVRDNKGGVDLGSFNSIAEGAPSGRFIEVGSGMESSLVDVIVSGQMPPNGNTVPPAEVRMLVMWINQGATFDGDDPNKPLGQLVKTNAPKPPGVPDAPDPKLPPIAVPTGNETVSFAIDIAPLLVESCGGCHGTAGPRAGFSVANFERLWTGGNAGSAIAAGNPQGSLLVQKLHGTAKDGVRMPQNRPAWSADRIALVEKWISEGATFDGSSPGEPLARMAALEKTNRATPESLSAEREQTAQRQWRLAIPDEEASRASSERFLAIGNVPEQALERMAGAAEAESTRVLDFFKQAGEPFNKGRITIFLFAKRIDYREFGTMVERRSLPTDSAGHARYDIVNPYLAMLSDDSEDAPTNRLLTTHLTKLWVADQSQGRLPDWFTTGAGMAVAARLHSKDSEVRRWRGELPTAIASVTTADAFMTGKIPPRPAELLSFGFVDSLLQRPANFHRLVKATGDGDDFEAACQKVFKRSPQELAELWVTSKRGVR